MRAFATVLAASLIAIGCESTYVLGESRDSLASSDAGPPAPTMCGQFTCLPGKVCCNASCGICTAPGEECDLTACERAALGPRCGKWRCAAGEVCCSEDCGTCAADPAQCESLSCPVIMEIPATLDAGEPRCGTNYCDDGFSCCNQSCGLCAPHNGTCTQENCS